MNAIRIYFSSARHERVVLPARKLFSKKRLVLQYDLLLCWLIRTLGRSHRAHICIGMDGAVLDPQIKGNCWWAELYFVSTYPSLLEYVEVRAKHIPGHDRVQARGRRPAWPTFKRWLTRGRTEADDCLTVTLGLLKSAGIEVDPKTHTIQALYDQLIRLPGARIVTIEDPQPIPRASRHKRRADQAAHGAR